MVYAVAAKGFRAGGVNSPIPGAVCGPQLALYGLTVNDLPPTYGADTVWSYEAGAKLRLFGGRAQVNAAAYRIDWSNIQAVVTIPGTCGIPFTTNAGAARSSGVELEVQARPVRDLSINLSFGYDHARYTEDAPGLGSPGSALSLPAASKGLRLAVPPWTLQLGARYERPLTSKAKAYLRADWWYARRYSGITTQVFGQGAFAPDNVYPNTQRTNLRLGIEVGGFDLAVFALNVFNSRDGVAIGGRNSCPAAPAGDAACLNPNREPFGATYNPFFTVAAATTPRQVGLQLIYRH
jgi:outer membrane receptor protein involved in Fe transport